VLISHISMPFWSWLTNFFVIRKQIQSDFDIFKTIHISACEGREEGTLSLFVLILYSHLYLHVNSFLTETPIFYQGSKRASSSIADKQVYFFPLYFIFTLYHISPFFISKTGFDRTSKLTLAELLPKFRVKSIHLLLQRL
jgi:hypothetical protein